MIDIFFIEFYIRQRYNQKLEDYFDVSKSIASGWRNKSFPEHRLHEFCFKEESKNILELFKKIYDF